MQNAPSAASDFPKVSKYDKTEINDKGLSGCRMFRLLSKGTLQDIRHITTSVPSPPQCRWSPLGRQASSHPPCRNFTSFLRTRTLAASVTHGSTPQTPSRRNLTLSCLCRKQSPPELAQPCRVPLPSGASRQLSTSGLHRLQQTDLDLQLWGGSARLQGAAAMSTSPNKEVGPGVIEALSAEDEKMRSDLREVFLTAVESVMPRPMLEKVSSVHFAFNPPAVFMNPLRYPSTSSHLCFRFFVVVNSSL